MSPVFKSLLIIVVVGSISFIYTDIESTSLVTSVVLPIFDFLALAALAVWFVLFFHRRGVDQSASGGGVPGSGADFFDSGGGGGGDSGC